MTENPLDVSRALHAGIDTHRDTHHVAIVDHLGRPVADHEFPSTTTGHLELISWIRAAGPITRVGVEGTGSYGATLTTALCAEGLDVVDVDRPDRRSRRLRGKSDPLDAYCAATASLSGRASTVPKDHTGMVESIRLLHNARRSAVKAKAEALTLLKSTIVTVPDELRSALRELTTAKLVAACAALTPPAGPPTTTTAAASLSLRSLANRITALTAEERALAADITALIRAHAPALLDRFGVGTDTAAQLLITYGDNIDRIGTEAAFARLCGVAPIPASSGRTHRHRLDRGGDRQGNRALYIIALTRIRRDDRTRAYVTKRLADGKTHRDIMRCLKRAIAREMFHALHTRSTA